jgi:hypothetical protein
MLSALQPMGTPIRSECHMAHGDWRETRAASRLACATFDLESVMVAGDGGG